jgi:PilZ domain
MKLEKRRYDRYSISASLQIGWDTESGEARFSQAKCLDVSDQGMRLETPQPIPVRSLIMIRANTRGLRIPGQGSVRYCIRSGQGYRVGVEFGGKVVFEKPPASQPSV